MGGYRKSEAHIHPTGVVLNWGIQEPLDFRESHNLVKLAFNLIAAHTENRAVEENVFSASQLRMKAGADLEQAADATIDVYFAVGWFGDAGEHFKQSGFARAVASNDADDFTPLDLEGNVAQSPEGGGLGVSISRLLIAAVAARRSLRPTVPSGKRTCGAERLKRKIIKLLAQGFVSLLPGADAVTLAKAFYSYGDVSH